MKHIGGRSQFLVIGQVFRIVITPIHTALGFLSALFQTTQKRYTELTPPINVRRGISRS